MTSLLSGHLEDCSTPQYFCFSIRCEVCGEYWYSSSIPFSKAAQASEHREKKELYDAIYQKGDRTYWRELDAEVRAYADRESLEYVRDDDTMRRPFDVPPTIVNYFFHEEVKKSAKKERGRA